MFKYLVYPTGGKDHLTIAVTINGDTVTIYRQKFKANSGSSFEPARTHIKNCYLKFEADKEAHTNTFERFIHNNDPYHPKTHSENKDEITVEHTHFKYKKPINSDTLKTLFSYISNCEQSTAMPKSVTFLSLATIDDMVNKYKKYQNKQNKIQESQHRQQQINYIVSNEIPSTIHTMPTIGEHAACLAGSANRMGCTVDNSYTPERVRADLTPPSSGMNIAGITMGGAAVTVGLLVFGMFRKCLTRKRPVNNSALQQGGDRNPKLYK